MKPLYLLFSSFLYSSHLALATPSSFDVALQPVRGNELDTRNVNNILNAVLIRQDGQSCSCDPKLCKAGRYRDRTNCRCRKCPPGTKPDPTQTACIPDKPDQPDKPENKPNDNDEELDKKKESQWEATKKRYKEAWDKKQKEKEDNNKKAGDDDKKDRKKERMGKCLPLVASSMMSVGAGVKRAENEFKYATNYFSEDFIDSDDILSLWPQGWGDAPTAEIDTDEYVNEFLTALDSPTWITSVSPGTWYPFDHKKRDENSIMPPPPEERGSGTRALAVVARETGVIVYEEKRAVKALFGLIAKFFGRIGTWLARDGLRRLSALKKQGGLRIAEKGKGAALDKQKWTAGQVTKSKNWKNCLNGWKPQTY